MNKAGVKRISISLSEKRIKKLEEIIKYEECSKSTIISIMIDDYYERMKKS